METSQFSSCAQMGASQIRAASLGRALEYSVSTDAFARLNLVRPQTIRKRLCQTGTYYGVIPKKLANGRLLWPNLSVERG